MIVEQVSKLFSIYFFEYDNQIKIRLGTFLYSSERYILEILLPSKKVTQENNVKLNTTCYLLPNNHIYLTFFTKHEDWNNKKEPATIIRTRELIYGLKLENQPLIKEIKNTQLVKLRRNITYTLLINELKSVYYLDNYILSIFTNKKIRNKDINKIFTLIIETNNKYRKKILMLLVKYDYSKQKINITYFCEFNPFKIQQFTINYLIKIPEEITLTESYKYSDIIDLINKRKKEVTIY
ncbi:MAG: hypothetical protein GF317_05885 [Candidatus Lokiarchaeota archaeon]|nr:hypothetical protein [Candidatus Lokiarchaeota archaeon]